MPAPPPVPPLHLYLHPRSVYGVFGLTACIYWFFSAKLLDRLSKVRHGTAPNKFFELIRP